MRLLCLLLAGLLGAVFFLQGCTSSGTEPPAEALVRVEQRILTVRDFKEAFEITKTAYSLGALEDASLVKTTRERLLGELIEEMVLEQRAAELGLRVTEAELDAVVKTIEKDYPEGAFEMALLESAVPFHLWKKRLKNRLIAEKVIAAELEKRIAIAPEEVSAYYAQRQRAGAAEEGDGDASRSEEQIVRYLRKQKIEGIYPSWMARLKRRYAIEINQALWHRVTGS
jgi:parvulin-like peptidyl-prolyl isomerase